jgi:hypothetical protein
MELLHMVTSFGDLYGPPPGRAPSPGNYDAMDGAAGTHACAFTKLKIGWLDASALATVHAPVNAEWTIHPLAALQPPPPGRFAALRIPINGSTSRYYIVEARETIDDYERNTAGLSAGIPGEGIVVYDVDESIWPPLWLRATLGAGGVFSDSSAHVELTVAAHVNGGGFRLNIVSEWQPDWRWCHQCQGLFFAQGQSSAGRCPATFLSLGPHEKGVSGNYTLMHIPA